MSGYTYASGIMTATVTARCPECNAVKVLPWDARSAEASTVNPCCNAKHLHTYLRKCRKLATMRRVSRGWKRLNKRGYEYIRRTRSIDGLTARYAVDNNIAYRTL